MEALGMEGVFGSLIPEIQHALKKEGYAIPTPVQAEAIPPQVDGRDLFGSAQTGTGKTAAFTIPLLQELAAEKMNPEGRRPRALILAPTRELAAQIGDSITAYGRFLQVSHTVIFGGVGQGPQEKAMNRGVDIVVATPGRLLDLMGQGFVQLDAVKSFILDEADRMLDMGFVPDVERIIAKLPSERRTGFFSATLPTAVETLAKRLLVDPVRVTINPEQPTVEKICQRLLYVDRDQKDDLLVALLRDPAVGRAIVFTQMKYKANRVCERLERAGITAAPIHGNKTQAARTRALEQFREGRVKVLVATDIAARGIDVDGITDVFNYDLPTEAETYVHRIGRTARAGSEGQAWTFCSKEEAGLLLDIERLIKKQIPDDREHDLHSERAFKSVRSPKKQQRRESRNGSGKKKPAKRRPRRAARFAR
ncbi:MAG: DEAD/DEAH box helicase [Verrucomicrobia bacterium]|nr:DEAD/DEAH box helicase [Verrucomicrobiota bacterium]